MQSLNMNVEQVILHELLYQWLYEWLKFIKLSMVMILGSVKNKIRLSTFNSMEGKFENKLIIHFNLVVHMYAHKSF